MSGRNCVYIANSGVKRILYGRPPGHMHYRLVVELRDGSVIVFSEATVANIVRAYVTVHTHPLRDAVEMKNSTLARRKKGYAEAQLLETEKDEEEVREEIGEALENCSVLAA